MFCGGFPQEIEEVIPDRNSPRARMYLQKHIRNHLVDIGMMLIPIDMTSRMVQDGEIPEMESSNCEGTRSDLSMADTDVNTMEFTCPKSDCDCQDFAKDNDLYTEQFAPSTSKARDPSYDEAKNAKDEWAFCNWLHSASTEAISLTMGAPVLSEEREQQETVSSLLELLTLPNPLLHLKYQRKQFYTINRSWFSPRRLTTWAEFNRHSLEGIFQGQLIQEANSLHSIPLKVPKLREEFCFIYSHTNMSGVFQTWNNQIVETALSNTGVDLYRYKKEHSMSWKKEHRHLRSRPDNYSHFESPSRLVVFPIEIMLSSNWSTTKILQDFGDDDGTVLTKGKRGLEPIHQVYTYCLLYEKRYGCILTDAEAFIFRIRPISVKPGKVYFRYKPDLVNRF